MNMLALIWAVIIASGIVIYVILDGFDLGVGLLSLWVSDEHERDLMVSSILPVWDGNETWLVFGGAALYGAFPLAFSEVLPAFYLPLILMVVALLFRGVAFEFRFKANKTKKIWDWAFFMGSLITTLVQGLILGTFVQGFQFQGEHIAMSAYGWLNPFSIMCAVALLFGYSLLGSNWLIIKTTDQLQKKFYKISTRLQYFILFFAVLVSLLTPFTNPAIAAIWFNFHYMGYLAILPALTLLFLFLHGYGLYYRIERLPFWSAIGVFLMCYIGFNISLYPYIVPRKITYIEAAANSQTLSFMTIGAMIMLPVLLFYTFYSYVLFKGKVVDKIGYE